MKIIIYTCVNVTGQYFLLFEYAPFDVGAIVGATNIPLNSLHVAVIIFQLLKALAYCHERNIVHCDVKPSNILLTATWVHSALVRFVAMLIFLRTVVLLFFYVHINARRCCTSCWTCVTSKLTLFTTFEPVRVILVTTPRSPILGWRLWTRCTCRPSSASIFGHCNVCYSTYLPTLVSTIVHFQLLDHVCGTAFRPTVWPYPSTVLPGVKDVFVWLTETPAPSDSLCTMCYTNVLTYSLKKTPFCPDG